MNMWWSQIPVSDRRRWAKEPSQVVGPEQAGVGLPHSKRRLKERAAAHLLNLNFIKLRAYTGGRTDIALQLGTQPCQPPAIGYVLFPKFLRHCKNSKLETWLTDA